MYWSNDTYLLDLRVVRAIEKNTVGQKKLSFLLSTNSQFLTEFEMHFPSNESLENAYKGIRQDLEKLNRIRLKNRS